MCGKVDDMWKHLAECEHVICGKIKEMARQDILSRQMKKAGKENARLVAQHISAHATPSRSLAPTWSESPDATLSPLSFSSPPVPLASLANRSDSERTIQREMTSGSLAETPITPDVFYAHNSPLRHNWTQEQHEQFASELCMLMIVCNIAWWSVEQPYWRFFFQKWMPGCQMPGRREMSGRILNDEAEKVVGKMKGKVSGKYGTGICDGWKNVSKTSLIASMINVAYTVSNQTPSDNCETYLLFQAYLLNTFDVSALPKTADTLLEFVLKEIQYATEVLRVRVVAWCTDAGGDAAKMRRLLRARIPRLVAVDCWCHQVNINIAEIRTTESR